MDLIRSISRSFLRVSCVKRNRSVAGGHPSTVNGNVPGWSCCWRKIPRCRARNLGRAWDWTRRRFVGGKSVGPAETFRSATGSDRGVPPNSTGFNRAEAKAVACEVVRQTEQPLSRQSTAEVTRRVAERIHKAVSTTTVWRWLDDAAIKPWQFAYWKFPRCPDFGEKAAPVLDLYAGMWDGQPLGENEFVISTDEKTSIQARRRTHPGQPPGPNRPARVEHEYQRGGALQYLAAWDVHRGLAFGRTEPKTGIEPFRRLVEDVMSQEPYASADRVFWIADNGSSHRGQASIERMSAAWPQAHLLHTPVHGSWLNQVEIYFSLVQRHVLTPNDFGSLDEVASRLAGYEARFHQNPSPFNWEFTRQDLKRFLKRLAPDLAA